MKSKLRALLLTLVMVLGMGGVATIIAAPAEANTSVVNIYAGPDYGNQEIRISWTYIHNSDGTWSAHYTSFGITSDRGGLSWRLRIYDRDHFLINDRGGYTLTNTVSGTMNTTLLLRFSGDTASTLTLSNGATYQRFVYAPS